MTPVRGARSALIWALRYGLPGLALRLAARRGDLIARSAADPAARIAPWSLYGELRDLGPLGGNPLVSASAHHGVVNQILRHDGFAADPGGTGVRWMDRVLAAAIDPRALGPVDTPSLLAINGTQHARLRRLVTHAFTPRAIAGYAERVETIAHDLLDRVDPQHFDLVGEYASLLPVTVIAQIMGVPARMHTDLLRIGNDAARTLDPALSWRDWRRADAAVREGHDYLDEHIHTLRRDPGDDLLSELIRVRDTDGERLTDRELRVNTLLLLGAGFETTVNLIGNAVGLLLRHPDQLAQLRADPSGWDNAVEEALRYETPVQLTLRVAREDVEVAGRQLPAGRAVLLMLGAANRDPAVFADPERFDVTRPDARQHLAFSSGAHYCLGAQLARLEASIALRVLFERMPELAAAGRPERRGTRVLFGWERFPVSASVPARQRAA